MEFLFVDYVGEKHHKLEETLEYLKRMGKIRNYEVWCNNQIKIEIQNLRAAFFCGVILGQFPNIKNLYIEGFKKHRV